MNYRILRSTHRLHACSCRHPFSRQRLLLVGVGHNAEAFDDAISRLRYGAFGINVWTAMVFAVAAWGAFPGNTAQSIGSGTGMVHNAFMLPSPQKAVVETPFRPAPRSFFNGELTLSPKPVFFITNKTAETTTRRLVTFLVRRNPTPLPRILASAMRGEHGGVDAYEL